MNIMHNKHLTLKYLHRGANLSPRVPLHCECVYQLDSNDFKNGDEKREINRKYYAWHRVRQSDIVKCHNIMNQIIASINALGDLRIDIHRKQLFEYCLDLVHMCIDAREKYLPLYSPCMKSKACWSELIQSSEECLLFGIPCGFMEENRRVGF